MGFQSLQILDLLGISFHAVLVFGLGKNLFTKYVLGRCAKSDPIDPSSACRLQFKLAGRTYHTPWLAPELSQIDTKQPNCNNSYLSSLEPVGMEFAKNVTFI